ncbi:Myotrophin [Orbilia brochopaga]|nr:Myotrophin [Drechslerella brochopaga]
MAAILVTLLEPYNGVNCLSMESKDQNNKRELMLFVSEYGLEASLELLIGLKAGFEVDWDAESGRTPLSWAAGSGHEDEGADINAVDATDQTPILRATTNRHTAVVKLLIEKGADLSVRHPEYDLTLLTIATRNGDNDIVKMLTDGGTVEDSYDSS